MHCDQCGKENRIGSKFCRYCGSGLVDNYLTRVPVNVKKINWEIPIIIIVILIFICGLSFGGYKAWAYYKIQSKITSAQKLQSAGDFNGSLSMLSGFGNYSPTSGQEKNINTIKTDDQKFLTFKTSFDAAVSLESSMLTTNVSASDDLQTALTDLQSIDTSYPNYKDVQTETTKIQNSLVTSLQNDANTSKKAAADAKAQAASAAAAKARAEEDAQKAQSEAASAAANGEANRIKAVLISFCQQVVTLKSQYYNGNTKYAQGLNYKNDGDNSTAIVAFAQANTSYAAVDSAAVALNTTFTNLPSDYSTAASNLQNAADYSVKAVNTILNEIADGTDESSSVNYDAGLSDQYMNSVTLFISSDCQ